MKLVAGIVIISILAVAGLRMVSRKLLYFPVPMDRMRETQLEALGPAIRSFSLTVDNTATLQGWIMEKDLQALPTLFYFGGNAEEVSLNAEEYLAHVAANVVMVNYRGYGQSGGTPVEEQLKADALTIYDKVSKDLGLVPERCGAWGRSLGSSIASYLAWQRGLGYLILTCPFDSIEAVAGGFYPSWLVKLVLTDRHRTVDFAGQIKARTLILAASDDEIIPGERTQALYDSLGNSRELVVIPGTGHNTISGVGMYYDAVNGFLKKINGLLIKEGEEKGMTKN
ncbi:MAG: hypothetical protein V6Z89_02045 [Desulfobacter sp.]